MRILIVFPRDIFSSGLNYQYLFPLGLGYISSALKSQGYPVDCLNLNHFDGPLSEVLKRYVAARPYDFILTGALSTSYHQIKAIVSACRAFVPSAKIILGGGIISSEPELMSGALGPDYAVIGEGEVSVCELIKCLLNSGDPSEVAGIGYFESGKFITTKKREPIRDISSLPWPDFEGFEYSKYLDHLKPSDQYFYDVFDNPRVYPIICSRSCPLQCTFCFHPLGNVYRQRSVDSVIEELRMQIRKYRINIIALYDELFSNNQKWLYEFCEKIKGILDALPWQCVWGGQLRVDRVDGDLLKRMRESGCYIIGYGFESYSPQILKSMKKYITPEQTDNAIHLTMENNMTIQGNFILGDIAETTETAKTTFEYWKKHVAAGVQIGFINPYPGTEVYAKCVRKGIITDKLDFIQDHIFDIFNMTDNISDSDFYRLMCTVHEARFKYGFYALAKEVRRQDGVYSFRVSCPHCHSELRYKNYLLSSGFIFSRPLQCRVCRKRFYVASLAYNLFRDLYVILARFIPCRVKVMTFRVLKAREMSSIRRNAYSS